MARLVQATRRTSCGFEVLEVFSILPRAGDPCRARGQFIKERRRAILVADSIASEAYASFVTMKRRVQFEMFY